MRSRTVPRPCACWRATASGPPSSRASSRRRSASSTSGFQLILLREPAARCAGASRPCKGGAALGSGGGGSCGACGAVAAGGADAAEGELNDRGDAAGADAAPVHHLDGDRAHDEVGRQVDVDAGGELAARDGALERADQRLAALLDRKSVV